MNAARSGDASSDAIVSMRRLCSCDALLRVKHVQDRSFTFILKTPPASVLLQKAAGVQKGSGTPNSKKVGKVTQAQLKVKIPTLWCLTSRELLRYMPELG